MFVTIGTEFSQFQSIRRIVSIFLSNISGNPRRYLINTVSTTGTFQNNPYSDIFPLGHEPPLDFLIYYNRLFLILNEEERKEKQYKLLIGNPIRKDLLGINQVQVIVNN
jgi:hypothetical protein